VTYSKGFKRGLLGKHTNTKVLGKKAGKKTEEKTLLSSQKGRREN